MGVCFLGVILGGLDSMPYDFVYGRLLIFVMFSDLSGFQVSDFGFILPFQS